MTSRKDKTRRQFLADGLKLAAGAAAGTVAACFPDVGGEWPPLKPECQSPAGGPSLDSDGKVVEVYSPAALEGWKPNPAVVRSMLDAAMVALAGTTTSPWRTVLSAAGPLPSELTIGLKINTLGGNLCTAPALVKAVVDSLKQELGLDGQNIIVWDRTVTELQSFPALSEAALGARVMGTQASSKDARGPGYDDPACGVIAGKAPRLSSIHTKMTSFTINCPVLKTHVVSGITCAMKNIYGIIDNPQDYHSSIGTSLPQLYALPLVGRRIRLSIVDALLIVTRGSTESPPDAACGRILVSRDPVAVDSRGLDVVNEIRQAKKPIVAPIPTDSVPWLSNADGKVGTRSYDLISLTV